MLQLVTEANYFIGVQKTDKQDKHAYELPRLLGDVV